MRKALRRLAVAVFIITAVCAVVGTGFALWAFSTERRADTKVGVVVNEVAVNGEFYGQLPPYAVLEESGGGVNGTVTGINFYNVGLFKKEGEDAPLEGDKRGVLYDTAVEISFKTLREMTKDEADKMLFGMKLTIQSGILPKIMHTSSWYRTRRKITDEATEEEYIDLKALVCDIHPVIDGKDNFEYSQNADDGTWLFTFRFTTTLLNMCFEYYATSVPDSAKKYNKLIDELKSASEQSEIVLTLWQGKEEA